MTLSRRFDFNLQRNSVNILKQKANNDVKMLSVGERRGERLSLYVRHLFLFFLCVFFEVLPGENDGIIFTIWLVWSISMESYFKASDTLYVRIIPILKTVASC